MCIYIYYLCSCFPCSSSFLTFTQKQEHFSPSVMSFTAIPASCYKLNNIPLHHLSFSFSICIMLFFLCLCSVFYVVFITLPSISFDSYYSSFSYVFSSFLCSSPFLFTCFLMITIRTDAVPVFWCYVDVFFALCLMCYTVLMIIFLYFFYTAFYNLVSLHCFFFLLDCASIQFCSSFVMLCYCFCDNENCRRKENRKKIEIYF